MMLHTMGYDPCTGNLELLPAGPTRFPARQAAQAWVGSVHNWYGAYDMQWNANSGLDFVMVLTSNTNFAESTIASVRGPFEAESVQINVAEAAGAFSISAKSSSSLNLPTGAFY